MFIFFLKTQTSFSYAWELKFLKQNPPLNQKLGEMQYCQLWLHGNHELYPSPGGPFPFGDQRSETKWDNTLLASSPFGERLDLDLSDFP